MKFIIATKDGKFFVKIHHSSATILTDKPQLAMRFRSKSDANRLGMIALNGEFAIVKHETIGV